MATMSSLFLHFLRCFHLLNLWNYKETCGYISLCGVVAMNFVWQSDDQLHYTCRCAYLFHYLDARTDSDICIKKGSMVDFFYNKMSSEGVKQGQALICLHKPELLRSIPCHR
uniref:Uncharacterized protein n=1 Tax=Tanacetum cinerariifolium TaxID=118510 RepID=A0A699HS35_TANCI|nr:hypothetical protein [Tanacetum cinerariifolium]